MHRMALLPFHTYTLIYSLIHEVISFITDLACLSDMYGHLIQKQKGVKILKLVSTFHLA